MKAKCDCRITMPQKEENISSNILARACQAKQASVWIMPKREAGKMTPCKFNHVVL